MGYGRSFWLTILRFCTLVFSGTPVFLGLWEGRAYRRRGPMMWPHPSVGVVRFRVAKS